MFFYLALGLICEGYWQVNSRRSIFRIADPTVRIALNNFYSNKCQRFAHVHGRQVIKGVVYYASR